MVVEAVPDGEAVMVVVEVMEEVTEAMEADNLTTPAAPGLNAKTQSV